MSHIHDQAMNNVYQQVLQRLLSFFSRAERTALQLLIQRLAVAAGGMDRIGNYKVLVVQCGSRDSCYTLALLRAAQLTIATRAPTTFKLRLATLRLNGMSQLALDNIHRSYNALFIYDDPRVDVLMVDNREVLAFDHRAPVSRAARESNRMNLLLIGHRGVVDGPLELWDDSFLATGEFHGQIARWNNGVDALVSGDSPRQQKRFIEGLKRAAAKAGLASSNRHEAADYGGLFMLLDEFGSDCYQAFYEGYGQEAWRPAEQFEACRRTTYIDIHDVLVSQLEERWPILTEFLGYQPDELAAHLGENQYVSVAVSAHLRGLQSCFVQGSTYLAGVTHYLQRALVMMRRNQLSERLCERADGAYGNPYKLAGQRALFADEAYQSLGLNEAQWVCLLFAPFIGQGASLERFLRQCHPGMLVALPELHRAMQGHPVAEQILQWIVDVSGLPVSLVGKLYRMEPLVQEATSMSPPHSPVSEPEQASDEASMTGERSAGR